MDGIKLISLFVFIALQVAVILGPILCKQFIKTVDCVGRSACALDNTGLNFQVRSSTHCAIRCVMKLMCVNYNYWNNASSCQLFTTSPFQLLAKEFCSNYDVIIEFL